MADAIHNLKNRTIGLLFVALTAFFIAVLLFWTPRSAKTQRTETTPHADTQHESMRRWPSSRNAPSLREELPSARLTELDTAVAGSSILIQCRVLDSELAPATSVDLAIDVSSPERVDTFFTSSDSEGNASCEVSVVAPCDNIGVTIRGNDPAWSVTGVYYPLFCPRAVVLAPDVRATRIRCRLRGTLRYDTGMPVHNGTVSLTGQQESAVTTNRDGEFSIASPVWSNRIHLTFADGARSPIEGYTILHCSDGTSELSGIQLVLSNPNLRCTLLVKDDDGVPIAGARFRGALSNESTLATDSRGRCDVPFADGTAVRIWKNGFSQKHVTLTTAQHGTIVESQLSRTTTRAGIVVDFAGKSRAGVRVEVTPEYGYQGLETLVFSDSGGHFSFPIAKEDPYWITATDEMGQLGEAVVHADSDPSSIVKVRLRPRERLFGTVRLAEGLPINNASIKALRDDRGEMREQFATTDTDGAFELWVAPGGTYRILASKRGFVTTERIATSDQHCEVFLDRAGLVSGTIRGRPQQFDVRVLELLNNGTTKPATPWTTFAASSTFALDQRRLPLGSGCLVQLRLAGAPGASPQEAECLVEAFASYPSLGLTF